MCCFSPLQLSAWQRLLGRPAAVQVAETHIFARHVAPGQQALIYAMSLSTPAEVAMILPLPVSPGSGEDAVRFVSLAHMSDIFTQLDRAFPAWQDLAPRSQSILPKSRSRPRLEVHRVGQFDASYVPSAQDFDRLDPRFRLPVEVWGALPAVRDYGFAVFKLRPAPRRTPIHPMALVFPTRAPERLFFPTVHIHDGAVHAEAAFDHLLYAQHDGAAQGWEPAEARLATVADVEAAGGLLDGQQPLYRRRLAGMLPNQDTWLAAG